MGGGGTTMSANERMTGGLFGAGPAGAKAQSRVRILSPTSDWKVLEDRIAKTNLEREEQLVV